MHCQYNSKRMKTLAILFSPHFSFWSANMQTLNMEDLQQVSGGFNFGRSAASGTGRWVGRGAGAFAGGFTGMALGAIAGPGGMTVGGAVGARVGGYLGGKLGSLVARRSFGY